MKKILSLFLLLSLTLNGLAQVIVQGHLRTDIKTGLEVQTRSGASNFNMDNVKFWIGTGTKKALLVIQWNDGKTPETLVWGYKWDGDANGSDMITAIAKADPRFYALTYPNTQYGTAIAGLGFDIDGKGTIGLVLSGNSTYPNYPTNGVINTSSYNFDDWTVLDSNDHWQSGWYTKGFWSYSIKNSAEEELTSSALGASNRVLVDGSWDVWNFNVNLTPSVLSDNFTAVEPYKKPLTTFSDGIFFVNEDWLGHANGSVNFLTNEYDFVYNIYKSANNDETLGVTSQYGTIYGDNFYLISKQSGSGGRLVVTDAKTLKKKASFETIGDGDGRTFVGVNDELGYIGTSNGIYLFNIKNLSIGEIIPNSGGESSYSGQIGNMILAGNYVFAIKQGVGALVIDPTTNSIKEEINGDYSTLTVSKDGSVWLASRSKLTKINSFSLAKEDIAIPSGMEINDSWGAWNAGSFCSSTKENALYWTNSEMFGGGGSKVSKYDIDTKTFNPSFFILPDQTDANGTRLRNRQVFYGAALRIDPLTGNLVLTSTLSGWGSFFQNNWVHIVSKSGELIKTVKLNNYYWFPALPVFPDNIAPVITDELSNLSINKVTKIYLGDKVNDIDNMNALISKRVESTNENIIKAEIKADTLIITPIGQGNTSIRLTCNSNGKVITKDIAVTSNTKFSTSIESNELKCRIYPNPFADYITIEAHKEGKAIIYTITGVLVKEFSIHEGTNSLSLSDIQSGMYTIKINNYIQKIIKR